MSKINLLIGLCTHGESFPSLQPSAIVLTVVDSYHPAYCQIFLWWHVHVTCPLTQIFSRDGHVTWIHLDFFPNIGIAGSGDVCTRNMKDSFSNIFIWWRMKVFVHGNLAKHPERYGVSLIVWSCNRRIIVLFKREGHFSVIWKLLSLFLLLTCWIQLLHGPPLDQNQAIGLS